MRAEVGSAVNEESGLEDGELWLSVGEDIDGVCWRGEWDGV